MYKFISFTILNVCLVASAACSSGHSANDNSTKSVTPDKSAVSTNANKETEVAKATNATPNSANTSSADKIGVPECDEYIEKYEACLFSKVPEAMRASYKATFEQTRTALKQSASNPQSKAALASGCKTSLETAKQTFASYSCQW